MGELIAASTVIDVIKKNAAPMLIGMLLTLILVVVVFFIVGMIIGFLSKNSHFLPTRWIWKKWPFTDAGSTTSTTISATDPGKPSGAMTYVSGPYPTSITPNVVATSSGDAGSPAQNFTATTIPVGSNGGFCAKTVYAKYSYLTQYLVPGATVEDPEGDRSASVQDSRWIKIWDATGLSTSSSTQTNPPSGPIVNVFTIPKQTDPAIVQNAKNLVFNLSVQYSDSPTGATNVTPPVKIGYASAVNSATTTTRIVETMFPRNTLPTTCVVTV